MADISNTAIEVWEWDAFLGSGVLDQHVAVNNIVWHYDGTAVEADPIITLTPSAVCHMSNHPPSGGVAPLVALTEASSAAGSKVNANSDVSLESNGYNQETQVNSQDVLSRSSDENINTADVPEKKKKRDSRIDCTNYPCSCLKQIEGKEDVAGGPDAAMKKRPKVNSRCQVPSCRRDISQLKSYHQRHRVCLECASSSKVIIKDQPHRYCQQCGKFHQVTDFDGEKKSCRGKLQRHNVIRRRQSPDEEDEEAQNSGSFMAGAESTQISMQSSFDAAALQREQILTPGRQKTHKKRKDESRESLEDLVKPYVNDWNTTSSMSSTSILRFNGEYISSTRSKINDQLVLTMLMDAANEGSKTTRSINQFYDTKNEVTRSSCVTSTSQERHAGYTSSHPTGRLSFKLYDWNPADFPRKLRQKILEWLANMPSELEGYIRSGCIQLTFFVSMPRNFWDKVTSDWAAHVQRLMSFQGQVIRGTSQVVVQMNDKRISIQNGKVTCTDHDKPKVPVLMDVYPRCVGSGSVAHILVCGFNISGAKFHVSFGGEYMEYLNCEPVGHHELRYEESWKKIDNLEVWRLDVIIPENFGSAFVEVESTNGISNYVPVLVADRDISMEINNTCSKLLDFPISQDGIDILTDMGWILRTVYNQQLIRKDILLERIQHLQSLSLELQWNTVAMRLEQISAALNPVKKRDNSIETSSQIIKSTDLSCQSTKDASLQLMELLKCSQRSCSIVDFHQNKGLMRSWTDTTNNPKSSSMGLRSLLKSMTDASQSSVSAVHMLITQTLWLLNKKLTKRLFNSVLYEYNRDVILQRIGIAAARILIMHAAICYSIVQRKLQKSQPYVSATSCVLVYSDTNR